MKNLIKIAPLLIGAFVVLGFTVYLTKLKGQNEEEQKGNIGKTYIEREGRKVYLNSQTGAVLDYEQLRARLELTERLCGELQQACNEQQVEYNRMFDACREQIKRKDELIMSMKAAGYKAGL
jgi:predicted transcriptional regulator